MTPLVSIIVAAYNAETYLLECLDSLSYQSYRNIQIIFIDDGSTDNTNEILSDFIRKESRAVLYTQNNKGVAAARQKGHELAKGDYIIHCDSDDFFSLDAIDKLVGSAISNNSDVVLGGYLIKYKNKEIRVKVTVEDDILSDMLEGKLHGSLCNKLIKRDLISDTIFEPGINYMEDYLFLFRAFNEKSPIFTIIDDPIYNYRMRTGSYTGKMSASSLESATKVVSIIELEAKNKVLAGSLEVMKAYNAYLNLLYSNRVFSKDERSNLLDSMACLNLPLQKKIYLRFFSRRLNFFLIIFNKIKSLKNKTF